MRSNDLQKERDMNTKSFKEIFAEARQKDSYWVEGAILDFTGDIERLMKQQNITNAMLADRIGTSRAYITKVLRGTANFTIETMVKLSRGVGGNFHVHVADQQAKVQWFDKYEGKKARIINEEVMAFDVQPCAGVSDWVQKMAKPYTSKPIKVDEYAAVR
jgi:plasmid maintenance system antidote protein VapI